MEKSEGGQAPVLTLASTAAGVAMFLPFKGTIVPRGLFCCRLCGVVHGSTTMLKLASRGWGKSPIVFIKALMMIQERNVQDFPASPDGMGPMMVLHPAAGGNVCMVFCASSDEIPSLCFAASLPTA